MAGRILVVDDEADVLQTLSAHLTAEVDGAEVLTATDGDEALEVLEGTDIDLLIVDQRMARMDGLDLLRELRRQGRHVRAIMFTAYADVHLAIAAINEGRVQRFYPKPGDPVELADAVREELAAAQEERAAG